GTVEGPQEGRPVPRGADAGHGVRLHLHRRRPEAVRPVPAPWLLHGDRAPGSGPADLSGGPDAVGTPRGTCVLRPCWASTTRKSTAPCWGGRQTTWSAWPHRASSSARHGAAGPPREDGEHVALALE